MAKPLTKDQLQHWSFACPDWEARLFAQESLLPDLPLDEFEAQLAVDFFDELRLPDVEGTPRNKEATGDWQRDIVRAIFGSWWPGAKRRMVSEVFCMVGKKNSKTTGAAAIMIVALLMNKRPRAEFLIIGPTQLIADTAFDQAVGFIECDPEGILQTRFKIVAGRKKIIDRTNKAFLQVKTFDKKVMTGSKPTGVLIDEIHVMGEMAGGAKVLTQVRGGISARPEGFLIFTTTQSDDQPAGCFKNELLLARGIRDGTITGDAANMLPLLYEFPEDWQRDRKMPWLDPAVWPLVNPNLGRSHTLDKLKIDFAKAKIKGRAELQIWASQHLNIQIGLALHDGGWPGQKYWEQRADPSLAVLKNLMDRCDTCVVGIDGGGLDDLLGLAVAGRCRETSHWLFWFHAWCDEEVLEDRKEIAPRLEGFRDEGTLTIVNDARQDVIEVCDIVEKLKDQGLLPEKAAIGLDPVGIAEIVEELAERGITDDQRTGIAQGYRLSGATWGMARKLKNGTIWHDGSDMMAWCVSNAKQEQRGNAVHITKKASGKCKIDPVVAGFNAVELLTRNPHGVGKSVYEERGLLIA